MSTVLDKHFRTVSNYPDLLACRDVHGYISDLRERWECIGLREHLTYHCTSGVRLEVLGGLLVTSIRETRWPVSIEIAHDTGASVLERHQFVSNLPMAQPWWFPPMVLREGHSVDFRRLEGQRECHLRLWLGIVAQKDTL